MQVVAASTNHLGAVESVAAASIVRLDVAVDSTTRLDAVAASIVRLDAAVDSTTRLDVVAASIVRLVAVDRRREEAVRPVNISWGVKECEFIVGGRTPNKPGANTAEKQTKKSKSTCLFLEPSAELLLLQLSSTLRTRKRMRATRWDHQRRRMRATRWDHQRRRMRATRRDRQRREKMSRK